MLNASYEPIRVIHWQKAMILWLTDKVEVLEFHSQKIRSAQNSFQLPSILRLKKYIPFNKKRMGVKFSRENVFLRDQYICQYCEKSFSKAQLTLDHVVPLSQGGGHHWENVVTSCASCNNRKGGRTPQQAHMKLLNSPFTPKSLPNHKLENEIKNYYRYWKNYLFSSS